MGQISGLHVQVGSFLTSADFDPTKVFPLFTLDSLIIQISELEKEQKKT